MRVYVDQLAVYFTFTNSINTQIFTAPGEHTITVMAEDNQGYISATLVNITVTSQASQITISDIQTLPGWQSCSALFPPGSGRAGQICAAGLGNAVSTMTQNQSSPSMDGKSAKFTMGGPQPYSNMLYFNPIAGGDNVSHFIYDLYFYIDNPTAAQALEFDVNQTFGGQRWVWGSECNFNGSGKWDIWNDLTGWLPTQFPCTPFPANQWIHLVWNLERVGNQVHYISLTIGNQVTAILGDSTRRDNRMPGIASERGHLPGGSDATGQHGSGAAGRGASASGLVRIPASDLQPGKWRERAVSDARLSAGFSSRSDLHHAALC